jgi:hypothetical protein
VKLAVTLVVALTVGLVVARLTIVPTVGPLRTGACVLGACVLGACVVPLAGLLDPCDEHPIAKPHASAARVTLLISLLRFFRERGGGPIDARTVTGP